MPNILVNNGYIVDGGISTIFNLVADDVKKAMDLKILKFGIGTKSDYVFDTIPLSDYTFDYSEGETTITFTKLSGANLTTIYDNEYTTLVAKDNSGNYIVFDVTAVASGSITANLKIKIATQWTKLTYYAQDDIVLYNGSYYTCNDSHTSAYSFSTDSTKWDVIAGTIENDPRYPIYDRSNITLIGFVKPFNYDDGSDAYSASLTYSIGDRVIQSGKPYTCIQNIAVAEVFTASKWIYTIPTNLFAENYKHTRNLPEIDNVNSWDINNITRIDDTTIEIECLIEEQTLESNIEFNEVYLYGRDERITNSLNTLVFVSETVSNSIITGLETTIFKIRLSMTNLTQVSSLTYYIDNLSMKRDIETLKYLFLYIISNKNYSIRELYTKLNDINSIIDSLKYDATAWSAKKSYSVYDVVSYLGLIYECVEAHTLIPTWTTDGSYLINDIVYYEGTAKYYRVEETIPLWESGSAYIVGDRIKYNGSYYKCILNTIAPHTELPTNTYYWASVADIVTWDGATNYFIGDVVLYNAIYYIAIDDSYAKGPNTETAYWEVISKSEIVVSTKYWKALDTIPSWESGTAYTAGEEVYYETDGLYYTCALNTIAPHTDLPTNVTYWTVQTNDIDFDYSKWRLSKTLSDSIADKLQYYVNTFLASKYEVINEKLFTLDVQINQPASYTAIGINNITVAQDIHRVVAFIPRRTASYSGFQTGSYLFYISSTDSKMKAVNTLQFNIFGNPTIKSIYADITYTDDDEINIEILKDFIVGDTYIE